MSQLGVNLKFLRKKKGLSQIELGKIAGITERTIYNYETGEKYPKPRTLASLANALDVPEQLLESGNPDTDFGEYSEFSNTKIHRSDPDKKFIQNMESHYGNEGAHEASELLDQTALIFSNNSLSEMAKDELFESITQAYFLAKRKARLRKSIIEQ